MSFNVYQEHTIIKKIKSSRKGEFELNDDIFECFCRCLLDNDYKHHRA